MKKLLGITLCLVIVMTLTANAFSMGLEAAPPEEMLLWYEMIDAIGEVTLEDEDAIDEIWSHYTEYGFTIFTDPQIKPPADFKEYYNKMLQITEEFDALLAAATPSVPQPTEPAPSETQPTEPTPSETQPTEPAPSQTQSTEPKPVDPAGDNTFMVIAMVVLSMTAMVVLVSKKRMF